MREYLRKRFEERLLASPLLADINAEDPAVGRLLGELTEGLYIEVEGLDLR